MSKADLLQNEDFQEYQADLRKLLDKRIRDLHKILVQPIGTAEESQTKLTRMEATTAIIAEIETIIGIPVSYLKDDQKIAAEKQKGGAGFMEMFRTVFVRENP